MTKLLIKNGRVVDPENNIDEVLDVLVEDGKIKRVEKNITGEDCKVIDATDKVVAPGLVDIHAHLRDPGDTHREDLETASKGAAVGGYTTVGMMPNTSPVIDNGVVLEYLSSKAQKVSKVNLTPIGSITKGEEGKELTNMHSLYKKGVRLFSDDGEPVENPDLMRRALQYSKIVNVPLSVHCEEKRITGSGVINEGVMAAKTGLEGIPRTSETVMVVRDLVLAEETGGRIHIDHVGSKLSVDYIRFAKEKGVKVTAEVTPHHLSMTQEEVQKGIGYYDTSKKIAPPLGSEEDRQALLEGLKDGTIDIIITDHAPYSPLEKQGTFKFESPSGLIGLETTLSMILEKVVEEGVLTLSEAIAKMASNPAKMLDLPEKASLAEGTDGDIIVIDPDKKWTNIAAENQSKSQNDPYDGREMKGKVDYTIVGGEVVVEGEILD